MRLKLFSVAVIMGICANLFAQSVPKPDHVVVLMLENWGYSNIIGSANAPHINALVNDPHAALFTQSYALYHPSQPNYVMLYSGYNQGITTDNMSSGTPFHTCNLGASLITNGYTFKGYSEDLPSAGSLIATSGNYARKHCPWTNWIASSGTNTVSSTVHQPYTSFPTSANYSTLPTVSFVIPNLADDMHNPTNSVTAIQNGDTWVYNNLTNYINWAKTNNSLLILTFDEDTGSMVNGVSTTSNRITTIFIGQMVQGGSYATHMNHYTVLRTLEDMYSLPHCDSSANYNPITACWVPPCTPVTASITNATVCAGTSVTLTGSGAASYTWSGGVTNGVAFVPTTTATYSVTGTGGNGCTNTATKTITVRPTASGTQTLAVCAGHSITVGSTTHNTTGTFHDILTSFNGCDSIVTTNLTVNTIDKTVSVSNATLTANATNATYQWINCTNGNAPIAGQTSQNYTATTSGNYKVIVSQNSCSDTSTCYNITTTGIFENSFAATITIYPNPTNSSVTLNFIDKGGNVAIEVFNDLGQLVYTEKINDCPKEYSKTIDMNAFNRGIYFFRIVTNENTHTQKVLLIK